jgi:hypothetical protein
VVGTKPGTPNLAVRRVVRHKGQAIPWTLSTAPGLLFYFFILSARRQNIREGLMQLRAFRHGLLQDGDVGVGVFSQHEGGLRWSNRQNRNVLRLLFNLDYVALEVG